MQGAHPGIMKYFRRRNPMFYSKCTWDRFMKLTAGIVAVIFFLIAAALAITVPSLPASMGNRAGLPSGSLYFWKGEWTGTWYKSGISSGTPSALSAIPAGGRIDISDDGKWLLHGGGSNKLTLFKSNGIYVMDVPVAVFQGNDGVPFCFYRRSPVGTPAGTLPQSKTEIFFASDAKIGKAIVVDLSTNPPTFGSTREVIRFNNPPNGCGFGEYCTDYTMHVSYNHAYAGNSSGGIGWLKIPNNGMGVGSEANVYKDYSGCDYAMTIDGKYCSQNSNNDHTKMPVFPFMELPRIIDDLDSAYALLTVRKGLMSGPGALTGIWWSYLSFGNDTAFFVRGVGNGALADQYVVPAHRCRSKSPCSLG
jgi:hypothetical protein